jgi:hypothetical protein
MNAADDALVQAIRTGFAGSTYPGDAFLQGSFDGCEPYDEVGPFIGITDWTTLEPAFLDARYCALSFFSEGAFRFFIPAYLVADVRQQLATADPAFHLTHGLGDEEQRGNRSTLFNPRRYGAMTWYDYARYRLSVFAREEASSIQAYLAWKRDRSEFPHERRAIDAALETFWRDRAANAPPVAALGPGEAQ